MQVHTPAFCLAVWSLMVGPSLCVGGLISHPCTPAVNSDYCCASCGAACPDDPGDHSDCGHGDNCSGDPCSPLIRADNDMGTPDTLVSCPPASTVLTDASLPRADLGGPPHPLQRPPDAHYLAGRPYPDRDLPLLI